MPSPLQRLKETLLAWSMTKRIAVILILVSMFLFTFHFVGWLSADPMPGARILEVERGAPGHRDGTLRRYELKVLHRGVILQGHMDTYWYVGKPVEGQVLDLRGTPVTEDHHLFYHGAWTVEFRAWFVMLAVFAVVFGLWRILRRPRKGSSPE